MKKPDMGQKNGDTGVRFASIKEEMGAFFARTAGKILLVTDGSSLPALVAASAMPRAVTVVLEEDALPLFAMPDGVGGVIAAGRAPLLRAARYFSGTCNIPCMLFPADAALDGALECSGEVLTGGVRAEVPLVEGDVVCDLEAVRLTLARAYARLLLSRLAVFEAKMLARFGAGKYAPVCEKAYEILTMPGASEPREIVRRNAKLRSMEREGLPKGEGIVLASRLKGESEIAAYRMLVALYSAFFRRGTPRKYLVPDYHARAKTAGCDYGSLHIPTPEEYAARALALERMRSAATAELNFLMREEAAHFRVIRALGGKIPEAFPAEELKLLPELCPSGLSAIIRDFGLLEL